MSIVLAKEENTVTLSGTLSFLDISLGFTISDINRVEIIFDARAAQSISIPNNYCVSVIPLNTTTVRVQRGGTAGAMVVHYQVIEYTAASGFLVDRGSTTFSTDPLNITIPNRPQSNRYARCAVRTTSGSAGAIEDAVVTYEVTSNTNLQVRGTASASTTIDWQVVYGPDQTVQNFSGLATGTSFNVNLTGLGIVPEQSFVIQSMRDNGPVSPGIDTDEVKGAYLTTNNLEIYSFFADSHDFVAQVVSRAKNKVDRDDSTYTITPFAIVLVDPVTVSESYINLCAPLGYIAPTNEATNNSQVFAHTTILNNSTTVTLQRFINGDTTRLVSEVVFLDGNPSTAGTFNHRYNKIRRCI